MEPIIVEFDGLKIQCFKNDYLAQSSILQSKEWEPHINSFVKLYNKYFGIQNSIDIGANFGYHTLQFSKETNGRVFAFEPQYQNYTLLKNNICLNNLKNVECFNEACGDEDCEIKMPVFESGINNNMEDVTPNILYNYNYTITKSIILDKLNFPQIDLIKIDVQGWEKKVLLGCVNILKTFQPVLIIEFENFQLEKTDTTCYELFNLIRDNDYYIFFLEAEYPADHICVHKDKLSIFRESFKDYILLHDTDNEINHNIHCGVNEKIKLL
jgi:FkbM family methyltransferase